MQYLTAAELIAIHDRLIEEIGGLVGVRDLNLLESAVARPRAAFGGTDQFPTVFDKAAALMESVATNHPFVDGNKRTAITSAAVLLKCNGYILTLPNVTEAEAFILDVAQKKYPVEKIAAWLEKHSKKQK